MGQNVHLWRKISNVAASLGIPRLRSDTQNFHASFSGCSAFQPAITSQISHTPKNTPKGKALFF
jgi:hypothetical protein